MAQSETVERILDAAEQLFAEKGFAETSLRLITSKAGVNLAAVNYHFGSKKALIQAVFSRFLGPFCLSLDKELERRQANHLRLVNQIQGEHHVESQRRNAAQNQIDAVSVQLAQKHRASLALS